MTSRSATVLVIFVVAVIAFCLASVFASMTGPISILPNETESGGILDNLSALTNDTVETSDNDYSYNDYSEDYSQDDSSSDDSDDSNVETTTDSGSGDDSSSKSNSKPDSSSDSDSNVETTTDDE